ncbi:CBN-RIB-2 protein [Aphelenchoides avenae]|nr:CBN-RIB-2 protein [Aphelenchus avenae]
MNAKPLPKAQQRSTKLAELFTVVMLTYKRDAKLALTLKEIGKVPFVHKVIVYWNDVTRPINYTFPRIHVPIVFLNASKNSMNNRFLPSELIETEAVFSFDDDKPATWKDILIGFA